VTAREQLAIALAAPIVRHQGGDDRSFGGGLVAERAASLLDALFMVKTAEDARALLASFGEHGQRAEWTQYRHHAGGAWKPGPEDESVVRKAAYTIAHRDELGDRGLVALDAMRSCAIAGWSFAAGLLPREQALAAIGHGLLASVVKVHKSWAQVAAQLRLAFGFTEGAVPADVDAAISALETGDGPWRDLAWPPKVGPAPAKAARDDEDDDEDEQGAAAPPLVALRLTVDCPGCGLPLSPPTIGPAARCRHCATEVAFAPDDWTYFFARPVRTPNADDPYINDFGKRFFSRTDVRAVESIACPCGAPLALPASPGVLACGTCGAITDVRVPDDHARAIHPRVRLVLEPRPARREVAARCAACDAALPTTTERIVRCPGCATRTFIDHAAARRPTWFLAI